LLERLSRRVNLALRRVRAQVAHIRYAVNHLIYASSPLLRTLLLRSGQASGRDLVLARLPEVKGVGEARLALEGEVRWRDIFIFRRLYVVEGELFGILVDYLQERGLILVRLNIWLGFKPDELPPNVGHPRFFRLRLVVRRGREHDCLSRYYLGRDRVVHQRDVPEADLASVQL